MHDYFLPFVDSRENDDLYPTIDERLLLTKYESDGKNAVIVFNKNKCTSTAGLSYEPEVQR